LPLKGSAFDVGASIRMAPGPDGGLYVSIPTPHGDVLALLGTDGKSRNGWPIALAGVDTCDMLFPVADGSVRLVCSVPEADDGLQAPVRRAFGFDEDGRPMHGWPVETESTLAGRTVGDALWLMISPYAGDTPSSESLYMLQVLADGRRSQGVSTDIESGDDMWAIGPDTIGYHTRHYDWSATNLADVTSEVTAFDMTGPRAGWPVTIDGNASEMAFDAFGLAYLLVGSPDSAPTRSMVLDKDAHVLPAGSDALEITSSSPWDGAGAEFPGPPIVGADGHLYVVDTEGGDLTVLGVTSDGQPMPGWPYQSSTGIGWTGYCDPGSTGCGHLRTKPAVGDDLVYLVNAPSSRSGGGSVVAITSGAHVRSGWPVGLTRAGAMFWSVEAAPDGGVWALAIEPEGRSASATILSIADDSTIRSSTTIVEP
jgi:hypothetical protein